MRKEHTEDTRKTVGNLSSTFLIRFARYPFLAIYIVTIPRMLGAANYGKLAFIISILMLASEVLTFGIPRVFGRFIPEYIFNNERQKIERLVSAYFIFEFIIGIILALTGVILFFTINQLKDKIFPIFFIYLALISEVFSSILFSILFGLNYVGKATSVNLFRTVFNLILFLSLYPIFGFTGVLFSLFLTPLLYSFYAFYSIRKVFKFKIRKPVIKEFIPKLKFGIVIFTPTLLFLFQQQIGPIFLKSFSLSNSEIGFFDLANQGFLVVYGLAITGFETLIPISSKFQVTGKQKKSIDWLFTLLRYILPVLITIIAAFYLFGGLLISVILGNQFVNIYPIALIILFSTPIWIIGQLGFVRSVVLSKPRPYFISSLLSTIVFILSGIFFIDRLGAIGLAITVILSAITYSAYISYLYKEVLHNLGFVIKKFSPSLISFLPIILFNYENIAIRILVFLLSIFLFFGLLIKLKIINMNELKEISLALRKKIPAENTSS